jgi:hypothetical protein
MRTTSRRSSSAAFAVAALAVVAPPTTGWLSGWRHTIAIRWPKGRGDPGNARLRSLVESSLVVSPLPEGYEVLSLVSSPARWDSNGWPLGKPAWHQPSVQEMFRSREPLASVQEVWAGRAAADGWAYEPSLSHPPKWWDWSKQFDGYRANFGLVATSPSKGEYTVNLSAPTEDRRARSRFSARLSRLRS